MIKKFIAQAQLNYKAKVCKIRTDNGTEFKNATLKAHYEMKWLKDIIVLLLRLLEQCLFFLDYLNSFGQKRRKPNVKYFHVFGSLCYLTNDRDDLGKMKPKADIGVFIGYSETSRGFRIYNRRTKKIMETIHVKFDELTAMASEHDYSPSTSLIIVDTHEAPPVVTITDEQTSPIALPEADELNQEDTAEFDGNAQFVPYNPPSHKEIKSSTTALVPSNVQNFHQIQPSTHIWTKDHPLD
ncbi:retrovirus-related pol polyprotein from transposon TNT 1-94 [Tanacetum coccineum]